MRLTYLTSGKEPSEELENNFKDIRIYHVDPEKTREEIQDIERTMGDRKNILYNADNFFLYTEDLEDLGYVMSRNMINSGMEHPEGELELGDTKIRLDHISRLPFNEDSRIQLWSPNYDMEYMIAETYMHKRIGDTVKVFMVTDVQDDSYRDFCRFVYEDDSLMGLNKEDYDFVGITDKKAHMSTGKLAERFRHEISEFKPKTIIIPSYGMNFDHLDINSVIEPIALEETDANVIRGFGLQCKDPRIYTPKIWQAMDWKHAKKLIDVYKSGQMGGGDYTFKMEKMLEDFSVPLTGRVGHIRQTTKPRLKVGAWRSMPLRINKDYRVPNLTDIFD